MIIEFVLAVSLSIKCASIGTMLKDFNNIFVNVMMIKKYFLPIIMLAITTAQVSYAEKASRADTIRLSEPVQKTASHETFGEPMLNDIKLSNMSEILQSPDAYLGKTFSVQTNVANVCQKKGCFFIAQQGNETIRISFKDYGFFLPTDAGGKQVTLVGELIRHEVSPELATHFSQDLSQSRSKNPSQKPNGTTEQAPKIASGMVYEIVASSVRVPLK